MVKRKVGGITARVTVIKARPRCVDVRFEIVDEGSVPRATAPRPSRPAAGEPRDERSARAWLLEYLEAADGTAPVTEIIRAGTEEGRTPMAIRKAAGRSKRIASTFRRSVTADGYAQWSLIDD